MSSNFISALLQVSEQEIGIKNTIAKVNRKKIMTKIGSNQAYYQIN